MLCALQSTALCHTMDDSSKKGKPDLISSDQQAAKILFDSGNRTQMTVFNARSHAFTPPQKRSDPPVTSDLGQQQNLRRALCALSSHAEVQDSGLFGMVATHQSPKKPT